MDNKTVFITGATKNTGYAIAEKFASKGFNVAISSRSAEKACEAALKISEKYGVKTKGYDLDLSDVGNIKRVFGQIKNDFKRLDTFVANSANLGINFDMLSVTEENFDDVMDINIKGTYFCAQQAALIMKEQLSGSIVLISSVHCKGAVFGRSLYSVSKGGIDSMARSMAIELSRYNIRTNCIVAGAIRTDRWDGITDEEAARRRRNWPLGIESTGEDIANGVYYLGSDLSKTVTGTNLTIDSGVLASLLPYNGGEK